LLIGKTEGLDPAKKVYAHCAAGGRSEKAVSYLQTQGFDAENIGGLSDWLRAGGTLSQS
jgi:rhodanese-related sulfurtransferase